MTSSGTFPEPFCKRSLGIILTDKKYHVNFTFVEMLCRKGFRANSIGQLA